MHKIHLLKSATFIILILLLQTGCRKMAINDEPTVSYLTLWLGRYQGKLHQWSSYPRVVDGHTIIATDHSYGKVTIDVVKSTQDSCLDLKGYYNDTIPFNHFGLKFSNNGTHFSSSGGGSTYSSLNIKFELDTLNYASFQKCGIPCSQGTDFKISKIDLNF